MNENTKAIFNNLEAMLVEASHIELSDIFNDYFYGEKFNNLMEKIVSKYIEDNCLKMLEVKIDENIKKLSTQEIFGWPNDKQNTARQCISDIVTGHKTPELEAAIDKAINNLGYDDIETSLVALLRDKIRSYKLSISN